MLLRLSSLLPCRHRSCCCFCLCRILHPLHREICLRCCPRLCPGEAAGGDGAVLAGGPHATAPGLSGARLSCCCSRCCCRRLGIDRGVGPPAGAAGLRLPSLP